jgi:transcriptional regulator with XRE-family HTH domain
MIRGESEYREATLRAQKGAARLEEYREELRRRGLPPHEVERVMGPSVGLHDRLREEIARYERVKGGDLGDFRSLRDLGPLLIAARIAAGLSQRDLARALDVHESQVSRDERNEYQGVSAERAAQILEALAVDVRLRARVRRAAAAPGPSPPGAGAEAEAAAPLDLDLSVPPKPISPR